MTDGELVKKISPTNVILKDMFKKDLEKLDKVLQEIFKEVERREINNE